jgi:hypothetical protein
MIRYCRVLLLSTLLISCGSKNKMPSGILPPEKMQLVLWDILRVDAFSHDFQIKDSTKNLAEENAKLQKQVFVLYSVTQEEFYNSYDYYKTHTELMKGMLDSMINKANRDRGKLDRFVHPKRKTRWYE